MLKSLDRLCRHYGIDGKIIVFRPKQSKKRLLARWVIQRATDGGQLKDGQPVAEITAGNFGIALAEQCRNSDRKLYLVPLGDFTPTVRQRLAEYGNATIIKTDKNRDMSCLKAALEQVIRETGAYSFRQFDNKSQIGFYKDLLKDKLDGIKIDAVFEKVGTGATMQAVKETTDGASPHAKFFMATPDERKVDTAHLLFTAELIQTSPRDRAEYTQNFERVLRQTENLTEIPYAKLSLFCAAEWLKANPKKTAFVFVGD